MSIVQKLTEGIVNRDLAKEGAALISKWENTGLLEGIGDDTARSGMARLLENQAKELLRESSSMAGADVEGFAAVAFPLVRRVFGSLIANDLVSVQPMSLPSGLIFFLDFTFGGNYFDTDDRVGFQVGESVYGGDRVGAQITGGVDLEGLEGTDAGGPYNLRNGYSSPTGTIANTNRNICCSGSLTGLATVTSNSLGVSALCGGSGQADSSYGNTWTIDYVNRILRFDPDLTSGSSFVIASQTGLAAAQVNLDDLVAISLTGSNAADLTLVHRLSVLSKSLDGGTTNGDECHIVFVGNDTADALEVAVNAGGSLTFTETDNFVNASSARAIGAIRGDANWGLEGSQGIPELDIKIDSVAVTAVTKKLKAKWTPELGQDLNAYHNLDAEVELTQILSEQIALEIDREIIEDLVKGATAGVRYWSRHPGEFLVRETGAISDVTQDFTGNVSEWYETLIETINDVSAQIHRKTLRGAANFVVCGPEVANILEFTAGFRANVTADSDRGDAGAVKVGSLSKKFDVMVDPYFPRNLILIGRRGSSFLESGYVYAPYVPLQTTPTIFGVEDFVPRKGVMTRYAKKMVRPDMYGLVVLRGLVD